MSEALHWPIFLYMSIRLSLESGLWHADRDIGSGKLVNIKTESEVRKKTKLRVTWTPPSPHCSPRNGELYVSWEGDRVYLDGQAVAVIEGEIQV